MRRRLWLQALIPAFIAIAGATRAAAAEPDRSGPSVCSQPCPEGQTCVGRACVVAGARPTTPSPPPAATPSSPPGYAPPSGYAPPPAYAPPPGYLPYYSPPRYYPPPPPPRPPRLKRRFLALPYPGMHSYQDTNKGVYYDPGLRVGSLIGGRINDRMSLNADLTYDRANGNGVLENLREDSFAFALSPLWQLPTGPVEIVFGPKAGLYMIQTERRTTPTGLIEESSEWGVTFGVNAGLFMPVSAAASIGILLGYELRTAHKVCLGQQGTRSARRATAWAS